jgi:hypothetical protein
MPVTLQNVDDVFTYHPPADAATIAAYEAVREDAKRLARTMLQASRTCADQQAAIRLLREAVMTINASIALGGAI